MSFPHQNPGDMDFCFFEEWSSCSQSCSGIRERHSEVPWEEVVFTLFGGPVWQPNLNTFEHNLGNPGVYMYIYTDLSIDNLLLYALNCEHVCHPALGMRTCLLHFHVCVCACVFIVSDRSDDCCVPCLGDWIVIVVRKGLVHLED